MGSSPTDTPTEDQWKTMHNSDVNKARRKLRLAQLNMGRVNRQWDADKIISGYLREEWSVSERGAE